MLWGVFAARACRLTGTEQLLDNAALCFFPSINYSYISCTTVGKNIVLYKYKLLIFLYTKMQLLMHAHKLQLWRIVVSGAFWAYSFLAWKCSSSTCNRRWCFTNLRHEFQCQNFKDHPHRQINVSWSLVTVSGIRTMEFELVQTFITCF